LNEHKYLENQKTTFTTLIEQLETNCWKPDDVFKALLDAVAKALRAEMNRRGLWNTPPLWLGVDYENWEHWNNQEAFDALCVDCYIFSITDQFNNLRAALKISKNIDSLIFLNIHHFISHLQRTYDSLGYAVAIHARNAIQCAIDKGIFVPSELNNKGKVGNKTLLTVSTSDFSITLSETNQILEVLRNHPIWKEIQLKLAGKSQKVQEFLCEIVCQLTESNILCFRFKNLVDAMKEDVRIAKEKDDTECLAKNTALEIENTAREELDEDNNQIVQLVEADTTYEDYESFLYHVKQVQESIDKLKYQQRVRKRLHQVFVEIVDYIETEHVEPSQSELVKKLNIPKATLNGDMKVLRELIQQIKSNDLE
jgi:hypothetical protein